MKFSTAKSILKVFRSEGRIGKKKTRNMKKFTLPKESKIKLKNKMKQQIDQIFSQTASSQCVLFGKPFADCPKFLPNHSNFESVLFRANCLNFESVLFHAKQTANFWLFQQQQFPVKQNFQNWYNRQIIERTKISANMFENFWNHQINERLIQAILS